MGHRILFLTACVFVVSACSQKTWVSKLPEDQIKAIATEISAQDWQGVLQLTKRSNDPLLLLVRDYAHFRLENFDEVLKSPPLAPGAFSSYQTYLKSMSAFGKKAHTDILTITIPDDLPSSLELRMQITKAEALKELDKNEDARKLLIRLLADSGRSASRPEILLLLADIEWAMNLRDEAIKRYRTLYETFPFATGDDQAIERLSEAGEFDLIQTETHLQRIQRIQRAAQFQRASKELKRLIKQAPTDAQESIRLAEAQLAFAMREYTGAQKLAKTAMKREMKPELKAEWQNLLAWSLIRMGQSEEGRDEYTKLLQKPISEKLRESLLYRLGASAIDDDKFQTAIPFFRELRERYGRGRFVESSHWFEAWALLQSGSKMNPIDTEGLSLSDQLLTKLPKLPDGEGLEAQSIYWRSKVARAASNPDRAIQLERELSRTWALSFYNLLLKDRPFDFLRAPTTKALSAPRISSPEPVHQFDSRLSWQRLEAFRSLHLMEWARLELAIFLKDVTTRDRDYRVTVANRLQAIEDWPDLVNWTERNIGKSIEGLHEDPELLRYLYPRAHEGSVMAASNEFKVSPFLIWGLMREESRFETDVRSHAGAEGLMQLMPQLSRRIGRALRDSSYHKGWMFDPRRNIRFGTYHLKELIEQVNDFPVSQELKHILVVAAYNAGIDPVKRWVKEQDTSRVDVFIESIPYSETRGYVKRVLQSANIYSRIWGRKES